MLPYLTLLGRPVPTYSLLFLLGLAAAWCFFHRRLKGRGVNPGRWEQAFLWGLLGMLAGAKALYLLPRLPQLAADLSLLADSPAVFAARYLSGGFVFYGGLLGALAAGWLFCRKARDFDCLGADLIPAVPLLHAFGRVGCFLAGCCYGIPAPSGWPGITFSAALLAPAGIPLIPVQLMEAAGVLGLFLLLARLSRRGWLGTRLLLLYLALYAPFRFLLEFLRGDSQRGFLGPLSTSQVISLVVLAVVLPLLARRPSANQATPMKAKK